MKINGHEIQFMEGLPTEEGCYLALHEEGFVSAFRVYHYPSERYDDLSKLEAYFGNSSGLNVKYMKSKFVKIEP